VRTGTGRKKITSGEGFKNREEKQEIEDKDRDRWTSKPVERGTSDHLRTRTKLPAELREGIGPPSPQDEPLGSKRSQGTERKKYYPTQGLQICFLYPRKQKGRSFEGGEETLSPRAYLQGPWRNTLGGQEKGGLGNFTLKNAWSLNPKSRG